MSSGIHLYSREFYSPGILVEIQENNLKVLKTDMESKFVPLNCNDDDVLTFGDDTYKVGRFRKAVHQAFNNHIGSQLSSQLNSYQIKIDSKILAPMGMNEPYTRWFNDGIDCEILKLGSQSWQKGKVRMKITVEFYLEETTIIQPESPLDDLRQRINQENHQ